MFVQVGTRFIRRTVVEIFTMLTQPSLRISSKCSSQKRKSARYRWSLFLNIGYSHWKHLQHGERSIWQHHKRQKPHYFRIRFSHNQIQHSQGRNQPFESSVRVEIEIQWHAKTELRVHDRAQHQNSSIDSKNILPAAQKQNQQKRSTHELTEKRSNFNQQKCKGSDQHGQKYRSRQHQFFQWGDHQGHAPLQVLVLQPHQTTAAGWAGPRRTGFGDATGQLLLGVDSFDSSTINLR